MKFVYLLIFLVAFSANNVLGQKVEVIKFSQLQEIINTEAPSIKVINFWATWCKPCIEELPYFEEIHETYAGDNLEKKGLQSKLYLLDETDYNKIIDKIDTSWSGAIPATLIVDNRKNKKEFYERQFKEGELSQIIRTLIN